MGLKELLQAFLDFRCSVVERRARFKLSQAQERRHIVEVCWTCLTTSLLKLSCQQIMCLGLSVCELSVPACVHACVCFSLKRNESMRWLILIFSDCIWNESTSLLCICCESHWLYLCYLLAPFTKYFVCVCISVPWELLRTWDDFIIFHVAY